MYHWLYISIQGYPQRMGLQRRLYKIFKLFFHQINQLYHLKTSFQRKHQNSIFRASFTEFQVVKKVSFFLGNPELKYNISMLCLLEYLCYVYQYISMLCLLVYIYTMSTNIYLSYVYWHISMLCLLVYIYAMSTSIYLCYVYQYISMLCLLVYIYAMSTSIYLCSVYQYNLSYVYKYISIKCLLVYLYPMSASIHLCNVYQHISMLCLLQN